jgi:predicted GNAT family acetyltransferase
MRSRTASGRSSSRGSSATCWRQTVGPRIARGGIFIWDDDGPVSLVGANPPVAGVVRIGPVYTPPEHRRRGYAGHAVAEVSRRALQAGASRCMLFTDLANLTSNKIYAEVGFRVFGDWEEHEFLADDGAAAIVRLT